MATASSAKAEQVGVKRQPAFAPNKKVCAGETTSRQTRINKIKNPSANFTNLRETDFGLAKIRAIRGLFIFEQPGLARRGQKIFFNGGERPAGDTVAGDEHQVER